MNCEDCNNLLMPYLLDDVSVEEREAVRAHLHGGCPRCAGSLAEAEALFGRLSAAVIPVDPPQSVRQKLLSRVAASAPTGPLSKNRSASPAGIGKRALPWALGLAASMAAVVLGIWGARERQGGIRVQQELADSGQQNMRLKTIMRLQEDRIRRMQSPQVQVASLGGTAAQPGAFGRLFLDRKSGVIDFTVAGLSPPPQGKTYELWVVTSDQKKVPVGVFSVNRDGDGFLEAPLSETAVVLAAVTDEPGLMPQPTGKFQLTGKVEVVR